MKTSQHCLFGFVILLMGVTLETAARPANNEASTYYLPFYGGAKGQYLEVRKDNSGVIISERIVSEDFISSEHIVKNSDDNLLSKVVAANLQSLNSLSNSLIKLHNLGRRTGTLGSDERATFKSQLSALAEAASNTIKLIEEVGDNIDILFKSNATKRQMFNDEEDVGEEGVGIDSPTDTDDIHSSVAEAKPVGIAIIGESGLASSRPLATAVALNGVAVARPVATAVAGINPSSLGIHVPIHHNLKN